eukprot:Gb_33199 [translate_table: standard]
MVVLDQPIKKRKRYDVPPPESHLQSNESSVVDGEVHECMQAVPSEDEKARKKRNREEIGNLYNSYRRIKFCLSQKDFRLMPDLEQAYLSMLKSSNGCASVQRVAAELIPRYALYCPTALEAASRVTMQIGDWSSSVALRGEDADGIALETAEACLFGLADISCAATSVTSKASVVSSICSVVFQRVLSYFICSLDGRELYNFEGLEMEKLQGSKDCFSEIKQKVIQRDDTVAEKLHKVISLSLIRIFFCCPESILAACFELLGSKYTEKRNEGLCFLRQIMGQYSAKDLNLPSVRQIGVSESSMFTEDCCKKMDNHENKPVSDNSSRGHCLTAESPGMVSETSLVAQVIHASPALRSWLASRFHRFCKSANLEAVSEASPALKRLLESFPIRASDINTQEDSEAGGSEDETVYEEFMLKQMSSNFSRPSDSPGTSGRSVVKVLDARISNLAMDSHPSDEERDSVNRDVGRNAKMDHSASSRVADYKPVRDNRGHEYGAPMSYEDDSRSQEGEPRVGSAGRGFMLEDSPNFRMSSGSGPRAVERRDRDHSTRDMGRHGVRENKSWILNNENAGIVSRKDTKGTDAVLLPSPKQPIVSKSHSSPIRGQIAWYSDGDPAAMNVFSASKQLWIGSLGRDATEPSLKLQFEKFGTVEQISFFCALDFGLVEYRSIRDAIKARESLQGTSPWGSPLRIKFLDVGLGSRGAIGGAAVGASCHVYIGKISSQRSKEELLKDIISAGLKGPHSITDLTSASALLLEFDAPEEAAAVMAHIRQRRREGGIPVTSYKGFLANSGAKEGHGVGNRHLWVGRVDTSVSEEELITAFSQFGELTGWKFVRQSSCCFIDFVSSEAAAVAKSRLNGVRFGGIPIHVEFKNSNHRNVSSSLSSSPPAQNASPSLSSVLLTLCKKYNINPGSSCLNSMRSRNGRASVCREGAERVPTNTLWIGLPDIGFPFFSENELKTVFNLAAGTTGTVTKVNSAKTSRGPCRFVEFDSVEAAAAALKNMSGRLDSCIQIEFSNSAISLQQSEHPNVHLQASSSHFQLSQEDFHQSGWDHQCGNDHSLSFSKGWEQGHEELHSPKVDQDDLGSPSKQGTGGFPPGWGVANEEGTPADGNRNDERPDVYENHLGRDATSTIDVSMGRTACLSGYPNSSTLGGVNVTESPGVSQGSGLAWLGSKPVIDQQVSVGGSLPCPPLVPQGATLTPLPPVKGSSFIHVDHISMNNTWTGLGLLPSSPQISSAAATLAPTNLHGNICSAPLLPSPVTPLARLPGGTQQHFEQMNPVPPLPPVSPPPPLPSETPPPPPPPLRLMKHRVWSTIGRVHYAKVVYNTVQ